MWDNGDGVLWYQETASRPVRVKHVLLQVKWRDDGGGGRMRYHKYGYGGGRWRRGGDSGQPGMSKGDIDSGMTDT